MKSQTPSKARAEKTAQTGVQSVEVAGELLKTLAELNGPQSLSALAAAAGLAPAKAHRYLVSLIRVGLVEQSSIDGRYDFGGAARRIGRVALNRLDLMRIGSQILTQLRDELNETVFMGVWTPQGPMVMEWLDVIRPVSLVIRPGSVMPIYTSAFGLICAAFLPPGVVSSAPQLRQPASSSPGRPRTAEELATIRAKGFSLVRGDLIQGLDAVATPVINKKDELVACLAAVGPSGRLDVSETGTVITKLKAAAREFSNALG